MTRGLYSVSRNVGAAMEVLQPLERSAEIYFMVFIDISPTQYSLSC